MRYDLHTHYYPASFFELIRNTPGEFSFGTDPTGRTIIRHRGARFFGVTAPMTDPALRLEAMDRVGIDVEVVSLSTPNVFFAEPAGQAEVARIVNDAYAELIAHHPTRFKGFASIPMDAPDAALRELDRAIGELKMNGVVLLSNIRGRALTDPSYRPFFEEANRRRLCIFLHPMIPVASEVFNEYVLGPLIGFPFDTSLAVARMCFAGMFRDFPDIRWVIGHLGGAIPYLMERLDNGYRDFAECRAHIDALPSTYLKRLHYDTVSFSGPALRMVRDLVGVDHMVMGSDFPHMLGSIDRAVTSIEGLDIPAHEKQTIFSGTALRILNNV
ncbi:MAG TPA: amidohydrolase family protein [Kofleriaceae bacterium]|jgi:aminocarboxymuconate-semialdehyde decarboxylase|nr:amidohydrolase family protein [Kofleriaceae bacterium]